jgi:putative peptidoglycan binding protein
MANTNQNKQPETRVQPQVVAPTSTAPETESTKDFLLGDRETKRGDRGDDVAVLQRRLAVEPTGVFNEETEEKVKWIQRIKNQKETGTATKEVLRVLGVYVA